MNVQEIISSGILELYCSGLTSEAETAEVLVWAKQYPEVAAEIEAIQLSLETYAQANAVIPAPGVKEKIFASINQEKAAPVVKLSAVENTPSKTQRVAAFWKYAAAASIILLVGSSVLNYTFYNKYQSADKELVSVKSTLEQQKELADRMTKDIDVMTTNTAMHVKLEAMPTLPDATARIYWMQDTKEVYIDPSHLPAVPAGKQYQFWAIVDGKPVNGGIITREVNGKVVHVQKMKSFGAAQAFAVSLEDAGPEKPIPSDVVSMGKM